MNLKQEQKCSNCVHNSDHLNWCRCCVNNCFYEKEKQICPIKDTDVRILDMIENYFRIHGYAPSYREIGQEVGLYSTSSVQVHMDRLFYWGYIATDCEKKNSPRAFRLTGKRWKNDKRKSYTSNI